MSKAKDNMETVDPICASPGCEAKPTTRGCCQRCYRRYMRNVKDGTVTESELIEAGVLRAAYNSYKQRSRGPADDVIDQIVAKRQQPASNE